MKNRFGFWLIGVLAMAPIAVQAQSVPLTQDSYVATTPATGVNYGTAATINVGGANVDEGLLQFDLTALPVGTTAGNINKATLVLGSARTAPCLKRLRTCGLPSGKTLLISTRNIC
jgi:hypothetical protein